MAPRVLISDALSAAAVQIFKDRGIEVDFQPKLGKDKDKLAEMIGDFDGLAIRSATKVTPKILEQAKNLKVIGRAGIGVDNVDIPAATAKGVIVMNTPFGNSITTAEHAITLMLALARADPAGRRLDPGRQVGEEPLHGRRDHRQDARRDRLRQYRLDRRRPRASGLRMQVIAYDPFLSPERALRPRRREGRARRAVQARRFHHAAHAAHRQDQEHHRRRGDRDHEEGRAHHQLRARRAGRRGGAARGARIPARSRARPSTCSSRSRRRRTRCSAIPTWSARRISAPPPREAQENVALQVAEQMSDYLLQRRDLQRGQLPLDHRRRGAAAQAVHRARREARLVRRPAHRDRHHQGADRLRGRGRADEHQGADLGRDRRPAAADAAGHQRRVRADRRQGARHRRRGDDARGRRRLREPDHRDGRRPSGRRAASPARCSPTAGRASSTSRASAWTRSSARR